VASAAASGWVAAGLPAGQRLWRYASVSCQAGYGRVTRVGQEGRGISASLGGVGERRVAELMQGPPAGVLIEQLGCPPVGQPCLAAGRIEVGSRERQAGSPFGEEHRAGTATVEQPWQEAISPSGSQSLRIPALSPLSRGSYRPSTVRTPRTSMIASAFTNSVWYDDPMVGTAGPAGLPSGGACD
jgi:hypothetical protein